MKLVKTAPHRVLDAKGTTYNFGASGECWLPDEVASTLPKTLYSIVASKSDAPEKKVTPPPARAEAGRVEDKQPTPSELAKETRSSDNADASAGTKPSKSDSADDGLPSSDAPSQKGLGKKSQSR